MIIRILWLAGIWTAAWAAQPVDEVRPLIGTHKPRWIFFASACRPFGMVSLAPDTNTKGDWGAGYVYGDQHIRGFSHVHDWQLAGVSVMPVTGPMKGHLGADVYRSAYSHESEVVKPGYHKLTLADYGITAELTSTKRVGFHRYSFPAAPQAYVLFDIGGPLGPTEYLDARIRQSGPRELAGYAQLAATPRRSKPVSLYFVAQFDRDIDEFGGWRNGRLTAEPAGPGSGGYARFHFDAPTQLVLKVAISYVGEDQARLNLVTEAPGWDFDRVVTDSREEWNAALGKIQVTGGSPAQRAKFYTDLWHVLLGRHIYSDVNGKWSDNSGPVPVTQQAPLGADRKPLRDTFTSDAFWGSWWNLNVLWSLAWPRVMNDQAASLVDYFATSGMIARGPSGGNDTFVMVGDQAVPLIAAAYNKGIRDFDIDAAWRGSLKNAEPGGIRDHAGYEATPKAVSGGMTYYVERGYVPLGVGGTGWHKEGAAQTLEYAYQDWCLSQFAKALGHDKEFERYQARSANWKNLYDSSSGWIRPKIMDGAWLSPFEPVCDASNCPGFVEGNAAVYTYFVPQDVAGLIDALGGREKFAAKLEHQFELAAPANFITPHGRHGLNWLDYENQPGCHIAHLFSYAGKPWRTQYWVRRIKEEVFGGATPTSGYNGDEDQGQMGALSALMAIGLFDVQGGAAVEPRYEITSPVFDRIDIELDPRYYAGRRFTIVVRNNSAANIYIQRARLNGKPVEGRFWITHRELAAGGTLVVELGPRPNPRWGVTPPERGASRR